MKGARKHNEWDTMNFQELEDLLPAIDSNLAAVGLWNTEQKIKHLQNLIKELGLVDNKEPPSDLEHILHYYEQLQMAEQQELNAGLSKHLH